RSSSVSRLKDRRARRVDRRKRTEKRGIVKSCVSREPGAGQGTSNRGAAPLFAFSDKRPMSLNAK
ncbi:MAG: hypothetical protein P4L86_07675, partial [Mycobacterium sp.]|nr:hypothetical protein [Mycobacterium sp.]